MLIRRHHNLIDLGVIVESLGPADIPPAEVLESPSVLKTPTWSAPIPHSEGGHRNIRFVVGDVAKHSVRMRERVPMLVNLKVLDHHWKKDKEFYIPKGGEDVLGRRAGVERHFDKADEVDMPRVGDIDERGVLNISDGRHRLAVLRDRNVTHAPVLVPRERVDRLRQTFHKTYQDLVNDNRRGRSGPSS